tara:strand:+ start:2726 stop:3460 length:735 start_codon:yes stop_codon:yes gene_type:complete
MKIDSTQDQKDIPMFVLCGGLGTRLRESLGDIPKSLAPVDEKPFLEFILNHWANNKVSYFVFLLGYKAELIKDYLEKVNDTIFSDCKFEYVIEEERLGTGGSVANALKVLNYDGNFFLINSDTWISSNLENFSNATPPCIGILFQEETKRYGIVEVSEDYQITSFKEKSISSNSGFINSGLYLLNSELFLDWDESPCSLEESYLSRFVEQGILSGVNLEASFIDIGVPKDYEYFKKNFKEIINE